MLDWRATELRLSRAIGLPIYLGNARDDEAEPAWSREEREERDACSTAIRRSSWIIGRAALKRALVRAGMPVDVAQLSFPHQRLAIAHCQTEAVGLAVVAQSISGAGIDFELGRPVKEGIERHFLTPREQADWLHGDIEGLGKGPSDHHRLLLWCIKEALFKSDNAEGLLKDHEIRELARAEGTWVGRSRDSRFAAVPFGSGFLAVAVRVR